MIRGIIAILYVVLFLILSLPVMGITWLVARKDPRKADRINKAIVGWGLRCLNHICGVRLIVCGQENIPKDEAVVYISNHRSFFDVIGSYSICPGPTGYLAKKEFESWPLLPLWMKRIHCLFLDRKDTRQGLKTVLDAIDDVKKGISIFVYPEGTRAKDREMLDFHEGSFKIATKSKAKIIPVAVTNSSSILEDRFPHVPWVQSGTVIMSFGKPIDTAAMSRDDQKHIGEKVHRIVASMLLENGEIWKQNARPGELERVKRGIISPSNPGCTPEQAELPEED